MIAWLSANIGTIIISILLILVVIGVVLSMINDKKQGRSTCGGSCAHCKMCTSCVSKTGKIV